MITRESIQYLTRICTEKQSAWTPRQRFWVLLDALLLHCRLRLLLVLFRYHLHFHFLLDLCSLRFRLQIVVHHFMFGWCCLDPPPRRSPLVLFLLRLSKWKKTELGHWEDASVPLGNKQRVNESRKRNNTYDSL